MDVVVGRGNDRLDLLQRLTTNDVVKLSGTDRSNTDQGGAGVQNILLTDKARIIDVFTVLARENDIVMLFSAGMGAKAVEWLDKYTFIDDFTTDNQSTNYASFLVFGVRAQQLLEQLTGIVLHDVRAFSWMKSTILGSTEVILIKQQPLCGFCARLLVSAADAEVVTEVLRGLEGVAEIDDATFETLRIEAAWGKHGKEWTDERNPLEAGLVGLVDFKKGCYIGQEVIARLDTYNKVKVRLSGFLSDAPIPETARFYDGLEEKRTDIGGITSSTFSPELGEYIALGYIRSAFANPGATVEAGAEGGYEAELRITKLPFVM